MKKNKTIILLICIACSILITSSCKRESEGSRKASLLIKKVTQADGETDALKNRSKSDDAADDPAIWVHPDSPEQSRIIGTDKKGGLVVYNLDGKELFYYADGRVNNVDVRQNITIGDKTIDIAACSNRTTNTIDFYRIEKNGSLHRFKNQIQVKMSDEIYGFCLGQSQDKLYAFANSTSGKVEQWEINLQNESLTGNMVRSFKLESQTEGMVSDDATGVLFIGEETKGIWKTSIDPNNAGELELLSESTVEGNKNIYDDIEGLSIYQQADGNGYLIASSQGNYSYAIFERKAPHKYLGNFRIADGLIDGVEETDGLDVTNLYLGEKYPKGMLVVQDGYNKQQNGKSIAQNFKMVRWEKIANLFEPKLTTDNLYSSAKNTSAQDSAALQAE